MKKTEELVVITKTYDLILWSCNHTSRFPRNHRFVLGKRRMLASRAAMQIGHLLVGSGVDHIGVGFKQVDPN